MVAIPKTAVPADIVNLQSGYRGDYPKHLIPVGASPLLRNVLCANRQVVSQAGWSKVADHTPDAGPVSHIFQVFTEPFRNGDPIGIVQPDEVNVWLPEVDSGAGAFQDITPITWEPPRARSQSSLDHDGNLIMATGEGVFWWPLSGWEPLGINPPVYDPNATGADAYIQTQASSTTPFRMIRLPGLLDERVLISKAWVVSHFEPHVMLGRIFQDDSWHPNRYAWSDTNNSVRWFVGFDEEEGITSVAGFADIPADVSHETPQILGMEQLRDLLIIYTDWNIWTLQFIGAPLMWVRRMVQAECGLAASGTIINCGDKHYFYGREGRFWEFNGSDKQPIGKAVEDFVNKNIHGAVFGFRRLVPDSCVWAFSTDADNPSEPDTAVAFNRVDGSWTIEDFPFTAARTVDASGIGGPVGAGFTYNDLDQAHVDYDALDAAYDTYNEMDDDTDTVDSTSKRLDREVMGGPDGYLFSRSGWTNDEDSRTHSWRTGVLDFGENLVIKHLSAIEIVMSKDGLVNQGVAVPGSNYEVTIQVWASDIRERCGEGSPVQTQTYRPGTTDDPTPWFRVLARFMQFEVTSTSTLSQAKPWAMTKLVPYLIPLGTR